MGEESMEVEEEKYLWDQEIKTKDFSQTKINPSFKATKTDLVLGLSKLRWSWLVAARFPLPFPQNLK